MDDDFILHEITKVFQDELQIPSLILGAQALLKDIPGWTPFTATHIVLALEDRFGIEFKIVYLKQAQSVQDIIQAIQAYN